MDEVIVSGPETTMDIGMPGTTVNVLPPESPLVLPVAVMVTWPTMKPTKELFVRVTEPLPFVCVQIYDSEQLLPAASLETAVYVSALPAEETVSEPETVTVAIEPGTIVTVLTPAFSGAEFEVAVIITVPTDTPVSLSSWRLAEPLSFALVQI